MIYFMYKAAKHGQVVRYENKDYIGAMYVGQAIESSTDHNGLTIIKYYEERTIQQDGKTKSDWKTVSGPYSRPQVCRSIVIIYFE